MFGKKIDTSVIMTTSKISLKLSCLKACNNDVERAEQLYNFIATDLEALPDTDPLPLSGFDKVKNSIDEIFGWIDSNQERVVQGINLIKGIKKPSTPVNLPSFPNNV